MAEGKGRTYAFGTTSTAVDLMARRTAAVHGAFVLPFLKPGMRLLDIGCGPGTITAGLAQAVAPGAAVGLDLEIAQTAIGVERAAEMNLTNLAFQAGSVLDLPFDPSSFDVVFGHTILMQFCEPQLILQEVRRVLRTDGLIAFREVDFECSLVHPRGSGMDRLWATLARSVAENDGFPNIGRELAAVVSDDGFRVLRSSASFSGPTTPEEKQGFYEAQSRLALEAGFVQQGIDNGWLSQDAREELSGQLLKESVDPHTFFANAFAEVVATKEEPA